VSKRTRQLDGGEVLHLIDDHVGVAQGALGAVAQGADAELPKTQEQRVVFSVEL
jgi:hypothetical protein